MNKIGIIFAMKEELEATLKELEFVKKYKIYDLNFYECRYSDKVCILTECGIGKVNAARCTQILIDKENVDCIFNVGVAGSVTKDVSICDVVIADKLVHHDFNLVSFNHERGYIPNLGTYIYSDDYLVKLAKEVSIDNKTHVGVIASGDIFVSEAIMGEKIYSKFKALCVEMEGAAIAQTCYLSNIPFLVIRSISDSPNKEANNNITFDEFLEESSDVAANFLIQLLNKMK